MIVLFDLDGTLTDPFVGIARSYDHALARLGVTPDPNFDYRTLIGPPLRGGFDVLLGSDPASNHERAVAFYRERYAEIGLFENTPYDGIASMLEGFRTAGYTLYVCTSKPTVFAQRVLEKFELTQYFRAIYGCELDGTRGDKVELLAWILARESLRANRCVLVGDRMHDVAAAVANGATGAGVLWGYGSKNELESAGASQVFENPREVTPSALRALLKSTQP